jgi:hypothetical protein
MLGPHPLPPGDRAEAPLGAETALPEIGAVELLASLNRSSLLGEAHHGVACHACGSGSVCGFHL